VLTRSQMSDHREQNKALSGIVQSMLITKHLLFVGFSLQAYSMPSTALCTQLHLPWLRLPWLYLPWLHLP
jgi:hypothetical protein